MDKTEEKNEMQLQFKMMEKQLEKRRLNKKNEKETSKAFFKVSQNELEQLKENAQADNLPGNDTLAQIQKQKILEQLKELKDENGRLLKLLEERDYEIKFLKKKREEEHLALAGTSELTGDTAATKIVELSRKNRELSADVEQGKMHLKQNRNKIKELEKELHSVMMLISPGQKTTSENRRRLSDCETNVFQKEENLVKSLREKLAAAEMKVADYRNQIQAGRHELRVAHKVIASEVGEQVNIQKLLSCPGSFRGRAQQIMVLQTRVRDLEKQLKRGTQQSGVQRESKFPGKRLFLESNARQKDLDHIRKISEDKQRELERISAEYNDLQKANLDVKQKLDASRARNSTLSTEMQTLKDQVTTLLEKGKHDNELVDLLMKQQVRMQNELCKQIQQNQQNQQQWEMQEIKQNSEIALQNNKQGSNVEKKAIKKPRERFGLQPIKEEATEKQKLPFKVFPDGGDINKPITPSCSLSKLEHKPEPPAVNPTPANAKLHSHFS